MSVGCRRPCFPAFPSCGAAAARRAASLPQAAMNASMSAAPCSRPEADPDRAAGERRPERPWRPAHGSPRSCRTNRPSPALTATPGQVERHHLRLRADARQRDAGGVGQPLARPRRRSRRPAPARATRASKPSRKRSTAPARASVSRHRAGGRAEAGDAGEVLRAAAQAAAPGRRRASRRRPRHPAAGSARRRPSGRPACAPTASADRRPSAAKSTGMRPGPCTASQCTSAPASRASATTASSGWITPVSLLASMTETTVSAPPSASIVRSASRSTMPSPSTGIRSAPRTAFSTE